MTQRRFPRISTWFSKLMWPGSVESMHNAQIRSIFRLYVNEKISHRDALMLIEKQWVDYQLSVAAREEPLGNKEVIIRKAALKMGITKGALTDVIKTLDLRIDDYHR